MRAKLVTLVVLATVLGIGSLLLLLPGDDDGEPGRAQSIAVEQVTTPQGTVELLVTISEELNVPATAAGAQSARLECLDAAGDVVLSSQQPWPLMIEESFPVPHLHQPASPEELSRLSECRFPETEPPLEGRVGPAQ